MLIGRMVSSSSAARSSAVLERRSRVNSRATTRPMAMAMAMAMKKMPRLTQSLGAWPVQVRTSAGSSGPADLDTRLTVSIGAAVLESHGAGLINLPAAADLDAVPSQSGGRNQVAFAPA